MASERKEPATPPAGRTIPQRNPQADLEELLFTLEICRRVLPWDAHQEHFDRLRRIENLVCWVFERR